MRPTNMTKALLASMGFQTSAQVGPVLIVLPRGLLAQWERDLVTKINPSPKVCVYRRYTII
jgi:hypothetical protein